MRITYRTISRNIQHVIVNRYGDLARLQEQLSTGKRLLRPSDDPIDVSNDLQLRSRLKQLNQLKRNIDDGMGYMNITDSAMMSMDNILQRLRELSIQAASDTLSEDERLYIANETEQLLRQTISLSNTKFKGDFVFAGTQTKIMPFPINSSTATSPLNYSNMEMAIYDASATPPGTPVQIFDAFNPTEPINNIIPGTFSLSAAGTTYLEGTDFSINYANGMITIDPTSPAAALLSADVLNGDDGGAPPIPNYSTNGFHISFEYVGYGKNVYNQRATHNGDIYREIESGVVTPINITARELLDNPATGTNLFKTIIDFGENLLHNNQAGISSAITDIDNVFSSLLAAQAKNGARINRFTMTLERNELQTIETTRLLSELEDAELAEVATQFAVAQNVYNAALQSAAKIIQPSLVNFL